MVAESRLLASSTSPERRSRRTHKTSWPISGRNPSMANTTRRCLRKRACSRSRSTVARARGAEFVVAVQEVGDRTEDGGNAFASQFLVDLRDAAMFGVAEASDQGED